MSTLVCLVEGYSEEEMLKAVLPRILPDGAEFICIRFEGKQDLERNMVRRIQYWEKPDSFFLVMRDKDAGDCIAIKENLLKLAGQSGKAASTLVRIACVELESFYLGDLAAVEKGLSLNGCARQQDNRKFREPDSLSNPVQELARLTNFIYKKVDGSRRIAPHLVLDGSNRSHSFNVLVEGVRTLMQGKRGLHENA